MRARFRKRQHERIGVGLRIVRIAQMHAGKIRGKAERPECSPRPARQRRAPPETRCCALPSATASRTRSTRTADRRHPRAVPAGSRDRRNRASRPDRRPPCDTPDPRSRRTAAASHRAPSRRPAVTRAPSKADSSPTCSARSARSAARPAPVGARMPKRDMSTPFGMSVIAGWQPTAPT